MCPSCSSGRRRDRAIRDGVVPPPAAIEELIARANGARDPEHALACAVDQCPHMVEVLDKRLGGVTTDELAAEQGQPVPSAS
jgi:hypothetical protein